MNDNRQKVENIYQFEVFRVKQSGLMLYNHLNAYLICEISRVVIVDIGEKILISKST